MGDLVGELRQFLQLSSLLGNLISKFLITALELIFNFGSLLLLFNNFLLELLDLIISMSLGLH